VEDDDSLLCAACGTTDGDLSDPIMFCDGCDLMAHASCYGSPLVQSIRNDDWLLALLRQEEQDDGALELLPLPVEGRRDEAHDGGAVGAHRVRATRAGDLLLGPRWPRRHRLLPCVRPSIHQGVLHLREKQRVLARVLPGPSPSAAAASMFLVVTTPVH
jgi:hypothetical protein